MRPPHLRNDIEPVQMHIIFTLSLHGYLLKHDMEGMGMPKAWHAAARQRPLWLKVKGIKEVFNSQSHIRTVCPGESNRFPGVNAPEGLVYSPCGRQNVARKVSAIHCVSTGSTLLHCGAVLKETLSGLFFHLLPLQFFYLTALFPEGTALLRICTDVVPRGSMSRKPHLQYPHNTFLLRESSSTRCRYVLFAFLS